MIDEALYNRQLQLNLIYPECVVVVGCGGIGSWVAIFAAMSGVKKMYLFDEDTLEMSNFNRLPFCMGALNAPKVEVVAGFIRSLRPDATIIPIKGLYTKETVTAQIGEGRYFTVIDCTDSPKTQVELYNICKTQNVAYIRAGYDGTRIMVTSHVSGWIKADQDRTAYDTAPSWVVPAATVAALAVYKLMLSPNQEVGLDLLEIGNTVAQRTKRTTARCRQKAKEADVPTEESTDE